MTLINFSNQKKVFLSKLDKSSKGSIDKGVNELVNLINSKDNYYTTSSCSGRVVLWQGDKKTGSWLNVSHDVINKDFFEDKECWLRVEPFIMHVCCIDLDAANILLDSAKLVFKKSSFLSIKSKIIVEIKGSDLIEMPYCKEYYSEKLLELVNGKIKKNKETIYLFFKQYSQS